MKNRSKILLALFIVLTLMVGMFVITANADATAADGDTKTVYFQNSIGLTDVEFSYNDANYSATLFGNDSKYDIYAAEIPVSVTDFRIVGTNGSDEVSSPAIANDADSGVCYLMYWDGTAYQVQSYKFAATVGNTFYTDLAAAIAVGGEVKLIGDVALTEKIEVTKNVTLDLNGYKITSAGIVGSRIIVLCEGCTEFVINGNGGSINSADAQAYGIVDVNTTANLTVNGGSYDFDTNVGSLWKFRNYESTITLNDISVVTNYQVSSPVYSNNALVVEGGIYKSETGYNGHNYYQFYVKGATATFTDVKVENEYVGCIETWGGNVTLNDCDISVVGTHSAPYLSMTVAVSGGGKLTVNGGNYSTKPMYSADANGQGNTHGSWCAGIMSSGGTMIINDGNFSNGYVGDDTPSYPRGLLTVGADADYGDNVSSSLVINGGSFNSIGNLTDLETIWGSANDSANTYMPTMSVEITGGDFVYNGKAIGGCDPISTGNPVEVSVSGGTYTGAIDAQYLERYYACKTNDDSTYSVVRGAAEIGETAYVTLQDAVDAANSGDTVVLVSDFELSTTVKVNKNIVLNLAGYTITGVDNNTTGNFYLINNVGTLTVIDSGETGRITLTANTNRFWNNSSVVIANNPGGKLTVNGGTIQHLGGTDMAYAIDNLTNGKGTYAETIINGGYIASTYRAIRQFLNGVEAENILTINGGTIEGGNKSVWMQDPSKNANTGSLKIGEDAKLIGDVYLFVTAGSTEWPVTVSIAEGVVEGEILTANVPAGYELTTVNGVVGLYSGEAKIGDVYYETLAEALKAAKENDTVILLQNITVSDTWDCRYNGARVTVPVTIDGDGYTLKLTGAVSDNNWNTVFRFEADATVKNLTIDVSEATGINRGISSKYSIYVYDCIFIGNGTSKRAIIFGEGAGDAISEVEAVVERCEFKYWSYGVSDNQSGKDAKAVTITDSTFTEASALISASESVTFTGNTVDEGYINITSYTANETLEVVAKDNTLDEDYAIYNRITVNAENIETDNFSLPVAMVNGKYYVTLQSAIDKGGEVKLIADITLTETVTVAAGNTVTLDLNGCTISMEDASGVAAQAIKNYGNLTIKDSGENGKITFVSTTPSASNAYSTSTIVNAGNLTIDGGIVESTTDGGASYAIDNCWYTQDVSLTINGGTIKAQRVTVRQVLFSSTYKNVVTVNGGEIYGGYAGLQVHAYSSAGCLSEVYVNGGKITGGSYAFYTYYHAANYSSGTTIVIDGGVFNGYTYLYNGKAGSCDYPMDVTIKKGTFNGGVYVYTKDADGNEVAIPCIEGGSFSEDASDYCRAGFRTVKDVNSNTYGVVSNAVYPEIKDGYWYIGDQVVGQATGDPGFTPYISENGYWVLGDKDENGNYIESTFKAVAVDGLGIAATTGINENGELVIVYSDGSSANLGTVVGADGTSIKEIVKTSTEGNIDTYTIYFTDDSITPVTFTVTNGLKGDQGEKGDTGIGGKDGDKGEKGEDGADGADGNANNTVVTVAIVVAAVSAIVALSVLLYRGVKRRSWWCTT